MRELTIGELARSAKVRPSALRYYESLGILLPSRRISGQRRYAPGALDQLAAIHVAKQAGFTMTEIRRLLRGFAPGTPPSTRWHAMARAKLREVDDLIKRARAMKRVLERGIECGCVRLADCAILGAAVRETADA